MSEIRFTPGPWRYQEKSDAYTHIVRAGEHTFICQLQQDTSGRAEADARLIAAAPDLLEALKHALGWIDSWHPDFTQDEAWPEYRAAFNAAIAKAEGRRP